MKKVVLLSVCLAGLLSTSRSYGQNNLDQLLKGSQADMQYLAEGYLSPALNAIGSGLNQGWYNTAATHKLLGFDITISASLMFYPTSDQFYKVDNNRLTALKITNPADGMAPTIFGNKQTPTYDFKSGPSAPFAGPPGLDLGASGPNALPLPIANLGIGLPKKTDLKLRFLPSLSLGQGTSVSLFGIGVMHDIKQYIPGIKMAPFDLSAFVGYTTFKSDVAFDAVANPSQVGSSEFTATTIQGVIGKKFSILTVYGSLGYNFASGSFKAKGSYPTGIAGAPALVDPVSISSSTSGPRVSAGLRLKFLILTIHGDYTLQTYNTLTFGVGLTVR